MLAVGLSPGPLGAARSALWSRGARQSQQVWVVGVPSRCGWWGSQQVWVGGPSWAVAQTERVKQLAKLGKAHKFLLINEWMNSVPYSMNVVWQ